MRSSLKIKAYSQTVAALGTPVLLRIISPSRDPPALVARWKHGDASVETNGADALRISLGLKGGYSVRDVCGSQPAVKIVGGGVGVLAPDRYSHLKIEGWADVVVIFIGPAYLYEVAGAHLVYE